MTDNRSVPPTHKGKTIDPLYIWSALAGLVVAFVLIAIAINMQNHLRP